MLLRSGMRSFLLAPCRCLGFAVTAEAADHAHAISGYRPKIPGDGDCGRM
jgi:hypothetical protein